MAQATFLVLGLATRPVMDRALVTAEPVAQEAIMVLVTYGERED